MLTGLHRSWWVAATLILGSPALAYAQPALTTGASAIARIAETRPSPQVGSEPRAGLDHGAHLAIAPFRPEAVVAPDTHARTARIAPTTRIARPLLRIAPRPAPRPNPGAPDFTNNVPENQPTKRFAGHPPALPRTPDPLPDWLGSAPKKLGAILEPDPSVPWMSRSTFNPTAIVKDDKMYLLVRVQDQTGAGKWFGTSRVALAESTDGVHFAMHKTPVLGPTEWYEQHGGTEDPRVTHIDGKYYMTYTGYNWGDKTARLCSAVSTDLIHWKKMGPMFADGTLKNPQGVATNWSKSGAMVPHKVNGEYLTYFGDDNIYLARSKDLEHWTVDAEPVMKPRSGYFDGIMIEPGPAPEIDKEGNIHLLYNGDAPPHGYAAGEVVFSGKNPREVLRRSNTPILKVTEPWEKEGQVGNVMFLEGTAVFKGKRFFYYGAADAKVGVAVSELGAQTLGEAP